MSTQAKKKNLFKRDKIQLVLLINLRDCNWKNFVSLITCNCSDKNYIPIGFLMIKRT